MAEGFSIVGAQDMQGNGHGRPVGKETASSADSPNSSQLISILQIQLVPVPIS
jgi:hypothetical protein